MAVYFSLEQEKYEYTTKKNREHFESFQKLKNKDWAVESYFGQAEEGRNSSLKNFTETSFNMVVDDLVKKIESNQISSGDQILFSLDSHGLNENGKLYIETSEKKLFPIDKKIKALVDAAEKKGVKLGLSVAACYSGALQKMNLKKTCLLTTSTGDQVSWLDSNFNKYLLQENNLENAFLKSRLEVPALSQPMISTAAGKKAHQVSQIFSAYTINPLLDESNSAIACNHSRQINNQFFSQINSIQNTLLKNELSSETKQEIENLKSDIKQLRKKNTSLDLVMICQSIAKSPWCFYDKSVSWKDLNVYDQIIKKYKEDISSIEKNTPDPQDLALIEAKKELVKDLQEDRKNLIKILTSKQFQESQEKDFNFENEKRENNLKVLKIMKKVKKLESIIYNQLYQKYNNPKSQNACRDFKL